MTVRLKQNETLRAQVSQIVGLMVDQSGLTRAEIARRLNVSRATVTMMLRQGQNYQLDTLHSLAEVLGWKLTMTLKRNSKR